MARRTIFVFGSNRQGIHGAGAAREAHIVWGAKIGVAEGLSGDSYAIITKELRRNEPPVTLEEVKNGVQKFLKFATENPKVCFIVTAIGCGLAGFNTKDIAPLFKNSPENVYLPARFMEN